jgi:hypothetical protein
LTKLTITSMNVTSPFFFQDINLWPIKLRSLSVHRCCTFYLTDKQVLYYQRLLFPIFNAIPESVKNIAFTPCRLHTGPGVSAQELGYVLLPYVEEVVLHQPDYNMPIGHQWDKLLAESWFMPSLCRVYLPRKGNDHWNSNPSTRLQIDRQRYTDPLLSSRQASPVPSYVYFYYYHGPRPTTSSVIQDEQSYEAHLCISNQSVETKE